MVLVIVRVRVIVMVNWVQAKLQNSKLTVGFCSYSTLCPAGGALGPVRDACGLCLPPPVRCARALHFISWIRCMPERIAPG